MKTCANLIDVENFSNYILTLLLRLKSLTHCPFALASSLYPSHYLLILVTDTSLHMISQ